MEQTRYVGMDVHRECMASVVLSAQGKVVLEAVIETKTQTVLDFITGIRGPVPVTFEEGTQAAWLYEVLRPQVAEVIVGDPRKNKLLSDGNKDDRVDARKLAQLLRAGLVTPVSQGEHGTRTLRELARSYECLVSDCTRVMNRLKALYRARAIPCAGEGVYKVAGREAWLNKLVEPGARRRAEHLSQALDELSRLRDEARTAMVAESRKPPARRLLLGIATLGPVRVAQLMATIDTPYRFRTKRQLWASSGLAVVTHSSADYRAVRRSSPGATRPGVTRGLNPNSHRTLKEGFKGAALTHASVQGAFKPCYDNLVEHGMRPCPRPVNRGTEDRRSHAGGVEERRTLRSPASGAARCITGGQTWACPKGLPPVSPMGGCRAKQGRGRVSMISVVCRCHGTKAPA